MKVCEVGVWSELDRTGGPVDLLFDALRARVDGVVIERLDVPNPADDDNVWWVRSAEGAEVQVDTHPDGQPPFYLEGDDNRRLEATEVEFAAETVSGWLGSISA